MPWCAKDLGLFPPILPEFRLLPSLFLSSKFTFFIEPEFDLNAFVDLIDLTLAVENVNSKLVDVVPFADVDIEEKVDIMLATADSLATS